MSDVETTSSNNGQTDSVKPLMLKVENLHARYGAVEVLRGLDFDVPEGGVSVTVAGRQARLCRTYGDVERGEALALINSYDLLEVAVAEGNAAQELGATVGEPVTVETICEA